MFNLRKITLSLLLAFSFGTLASAQQPQQSQQTDSLVVYFHEASSEFDRDYRQNGERFDAFLELIKQMPQHMKVVKVEYCGVTSPEDVYSYNERLSKSRAESIIDYLHRYIRFDDSVVFVYSVVEDWDALAEFVENDLQTPDRDAVLKIIRSDLGVRREPALKNLNGAAAWNYLDEKYFPELRYCRVTVTSEFDASVTETIVIQQEEVQQEEVQQEPQPVVQSEPEPQPQPEPQPEPALVLAPAPVEEQQQSEEDPAEGRWTLKTNLIGWGFAQANLAVEFDIVKHLSIAVPVYYSGGFDIVKDRVKFRSLIFQPELRYYPWLNKRGNNGGFFLGAHFGMGWYNFAIGGDYRTQDHQGKHPSLGGGLSIGGSFQFKRNPNWGMEFAVGGGAYKSKYDLFYNEANGPYYKKGIEKMWYGVDNASISFTYTFNAKQKGGKK
jgi:outer membrane protein OmpA-like peptidoglycan-associated protein